MQLKNIICLNIRAHWSFPILLTLSSVGFWDSEISRCLLRLFLGLLRWFLFLLCTLLLLVFPRSICPCTALTGGSMKMTANIYIWLWFLPGFWEDFSEFNVQSSHQIWFLKYRQYYLSHSPTILGAIILLMTYVYLSLPGFKELMTTSNIRVATIKKRK